MRKSAHELIVELFRDLLRDYAKAELEAKNYAQKTFVQKRAKRIRKMLTRLSGCAGAATKALRRKAADRPGPTSS